MKTSKEIRQEFIEFFKEKEHTFVRSSPVVPNDDPTLLFTNAGMNQFKPIFVGDAAPEQLRAVNSQKCIRVSGKHNDLEEVGVDHYHHTFFEMLGNWSFGDYYKAEAITWAWELLTEVWKMDKDRLWVTVHDTDDEALKLWLELTDIAEDRVLKFGDKENFWEMGATGPCGPCSEIHYYIGPDLSKMVASGVNAEDEYREIWNLVFIQNMRLEDGSLEDLPQKHVDTGAGLERIVGVLQQKNSNYSTDLFTSIIDEVVKITGHPYDEGEAGTPHRVLADHVRMVTFSLADGALPSNEGRGYVVRRILRRAARFGRILDQHEPFIYRLVDSVIEKMGEAYPEIVERKDHIKKVIQAEEASFGETLDRGLEIFAGIVKTLSEGDTIAGSDAFKLYDTYGFPLDLTELMARERDLSVDRNGFDSAMAAQRERARASAGKGGDETDVPWVTVNGGSGTNFLGYETTEATATVRKYRDLGESSVEITLDQTTFYAESGGQVGDTGTLTADGLKISITDTQKRAVDGASEFVHRGNLISGSLDNLASVTVTVDAERRQAIRLNHTATHLMHAALKTVLGDHVGQAGSLVAPDRLRFDLTHYEKITPDQLAEIEVIVNNEIRRNSAVGSNEMSFDDAKASGAVAMFGEKYGDRVRVIAVPDFSKEFCGGTHVGRTGDIGSFTITSESSVGSGIRRIEAVTGAGALAYAQEQNQLKSEKLASLRQQVKDLEQKLKKANSQSGKDLTAELMGKLTHIDGVQAIVSVVDVPDMNSLKDLAVSLKHRLKSGIIALGYESEGKSNFVIAVSDNLKTEIHAGQFIKVVAKILDGGGGGSPTLATAGGKSEKSLKDALAQIPELLKQFRAERNT